MRRRTYKATLLSPRTAVLGVEQTASPPNLRRSEKVLEDLKTGIITAEKNIKDDAQTKPDTNMKMLQDRSKALKHITLKVNPAGRFSI